MNNHSGPRSEESVERQNGLEEVFIEIIVEKFSNLEKYMGSTL